MFVYVNVGIYYLCVRWYFGFRWCFGEGCFYDFICFKNFGIKIYCFFVVVIKK